MDKLRTIKTPSQPIATFDQTVRPVLSSPYVALRRYLESQLELLSQPECNHVKLILDLKPDNDPELLFALIQKSLMAIPDWQRSLAPRVVLGLW